jgi:membrane-associated phospholipid phosphatase
VLGILSVSFSAFADEGAPASPAASSASSASSAPGNSTVPATSTIPVAGKPLATGLPHRHEGTQLKWDPGFNRMDLPEMIVSATAAGITLATAIAPPLKTGWQGGNSFDDAIRNTLRASSFQARLDARDASDVGLAFITTFPILVDSLLVAYWYRGSNDVALQMGLIDIEALTIAGAVQGTANFFAGRERPYGQGCGTQIPNDTVDCQSTSRYRSFFSGHSTLSFTSASLICAHHLALHLFESEADAVACASGYLAAATIATLRVVGDVHYASDVLTGAAVGTAIGLGLPLLHHYKRESPDPGAHAGLQMHVVPSLAGATLVGTF